MWTPHLCFVSGQGPALKARIIIVCNHRRSFGPGGFCSPPRALGSASSLPARGQPRHVGRVAGPQWLGAGGSGTLQPQVWGKVRAHNKVWTKFEVLRPKREKKGKGIKVHPHRSIASA